jgi:hypothetical protein
MRLSYGFFWAKNINHAASLSPILKLQLGSKFIDLGR